MFKKWHAAIVWLVAAALAAISSAQPWATNGAFPVTGSDVTGGLSSALAWIAVAMAGVLLVLRRLGTRVVGVVALVLGIGALVASLTTSFPAQDLPPAVTQTALASSWRHAVTAASALTAIGGALALLAAPTISAARTSRYDRETSTSSASAAAQTDPWKAMDAGEDPTADPR